MIETIRFTPPWLVAAKGGAGAKPKKQASALPVFILRAGSIIERDQFEAELEGRYAAGMVMNFQLLEAAVSGVRALLGEDGGEIEELLRADFAASTGGEADQLGAQDRAKLKTATEILTRSWPDYAALVEREAQRNALLPTLAFVRWCEGWENVTDREGQPLAFTRSALGDVPDAVLRALDFTVLRAAGMEAYRLQYGRSHAKN